MLIVLLSRYTLSMFSRYKISNDLATCVEIKCPLLFFSLDVLIMLKWRCLLIT